MHLKYQNVNTAFYGLVRGIHTGEIPTIRTSSRVGDVLQVVEPVIITYENPRQRVLFNQARDANPFMHLFESMWMLAGRNDVAPMKYYSSKIGDIASDDGEIFNGAYGYRWRRSKGKHPVSMSDQDCKAWHVPKGSMSEIPNDVDQLKILIAHLKRKPESRRAVLQMWNVEDDLLKIDVTKDTCCNLSVMFSIRKEICGPTDVDPMERTMPVIENRYLDMTVTNRSNDMIWGMLGANAVHFSFLQEYMANCIGVEVGVYNQISNNLHVYVENNGGFKPVEWLGWYDGSDVSEPYEEPNWYSKLGPMLLEGTDQQNLDDEIRAFIDFPFDFPPQDKWQSKFLNNVADPICRAFYFHKERDYDASIYWCGEIQAEDWRVAATQWIRKRKQMWEKKQNANVD